ncbi:hypothetical protein tloyanaT_25950 [Thalassotalea loyana]|uniref:HTH marR-type domain-containing protein n=1 Tax=Thalassotalea loyana TaxID=280483 RepID=A0ABQ6HHX0_9GAMM|nr:MarR family transcriptional regulator [Thalassotalea loyana]GLX86342.1 hypothetical protein tloyanaT_25950 [Thalassotalea loyana]
MSCKYFSTSQNRLLKVMKALVGHEANGISHSDLAKATQCSASEITRTLDNLEFEGFVEKHPQSPNKYRLTARFSAIANTVSLNLRNATQQLEQDSLNYAKLW